MSTAPYDLKREVEKQPRLVGGHRLCAGCGAGIVVSNVLRALEPEDKAVVVNATSCLEVSTFMYPFTAYTDSFMHSAFENSAATCSGVEAAYNASSAAASSTKPTSSSPSAATAAPTTSASSPSPARWSAATTWSMSATTTKPT